MATSQAQSIYGNVSRASADAAAQLIADAVCGERRRARVLFAALLRLARRDAGAGAFLERAPAIARLLGLVS